jgi:hypothetical protein
MNFFERSLPLSDSEIMARNGDKILIEKDGRAYCVTPEVIVAIDASVEELCFGKTLAEMSREIDSAVDVATHMPIYADYRGEFVWLRLSRKHSVWNAHMQSFY